jgi:Ca2+-transporting ATPase
MPCAVRGMERQIVWVGMLMGLLSLAIAYGYWSAHNQAWQTMVFTTLTVSQMANLMAIRSERRSLSEIGLTSNLPLLGAVGLMVIFQLFLIYVPFLQSNLKTVALPVSDLALALWVSSAIFWAVELGKWFLRQQPKTS